MTNSHKTLLSILLFLISVNCFLHMPASRVETLSKTTEVSPEADRTETVVYQFSGIEKFLEWVGFGFLLFAVWIWREQLGINQIGGVIGAPGRVTQQDPGAPSKPPEESDSPPEIDLSSISNEMKDHETKERLEHIMEMFKRLHSISAQHVARELHVSANTAKSYLFLLQKSGQIRVDGFPTHKIYTAAKSLENRILDAVKYRISKNYEILTERRYVRVKKVYEVDSLLTTSECTFIVEAKVLRSSNLIDRLDNWILQILNVAKEFKRDKAVCVLAIACMDEAKPELIKRQIDAMTFDSGNTPVEVFVLSELELSD